MFAFAYFLIIESFLHRHALNVYNMNCAVYTGGAESVRKKEMSTLNYVLSIKVNNYHNLFTALQSLIKRNNTNNNNRTFT